jgi:hypothetical protein
MSIWMLIKTYNKILSKLSHLSCFLMTPQLYERVDKWTHEPRSILNHKKHLSIAFTFSALNKFENNKKRYFRQSHTKPKNNFTLCISLHFSFSLLSLNLLLPIYFYFILLISKHCAWQPHSGVGGTRQRTCFAGC